MDILKIINKIIGIVNYKTDLVVTDDKLLHKKSIYINNFKKYFQISKIDDCLKSPLIKKLDLYVFFWIKYKLINIKYTNKKFYNLLILLNQAIIKYYYYNHSIYNTYI